ncbi:MAG TPA: 30S ribosomal protein S12 methylthiotransferase RimO [Caldithrix abyssi]|uniref:Ribosomal protein uS12 methylthiotransferase RimO n=1 Tax=Caldithrix abyssi TaxID=187145 RepID=A0A7V5UE24_CALAY|nr:30S ribosomal protein S12 methylthiotransferase RimO [Caldithrix abyssi]
MKKIHVTTLGCSKNTVDSEVLMGQLEANDFQIINDPQDADVLIINTCGFIQDAKEESIQTIFEALKLKEQDPAKKVYVAGCLTQRYRKEIEKEIPEVDAVFGTEEYRAILNALGKKHAAEDNLHRMRKLSTPRHYAYLKISEGCDHTCAFCAIPGIRGAFRSRTMDSLVDETKKLAENGAREIILISQDTSAYGKDIYGRGSIVDLVERLAQVDGVEWLRILYWYPTNFPTEILRLMRDHDKVLPYIDLPLQHISDKVLRMMRRGETKASIYKLVETIRAQVPNVALRTTLIVGHPGEGEREFRELYDFVREIKFDRLGTFTYSDEEGTFAFTLPEKVEPQVAAERQQEIMELQREISLQNNRRLVGRKELVLIDEYHAPSRTYIGRTYRDAPEIDNEVLISVKDGLRQVPTGRFVPVKIVDVSEYELYGEFG